jgi:hypothetical protein
LTPTAASWTSLWELSPESPQASTLFCTLGPLQPLWFRVVCSVVISGALHPRHCKTFILLCRAAQGTSLPVDGQISPWQQITQPFFVSSDKINKGSGSLKRLRFWQGTWLESGPLNVKHRIISIGRALHVQVLIPSTRLDTMSPAAKTSNIFERLLHLTPLQPT